MCLLLRGRLSERVGVLVQIYNRLLLFCAFFGYLGVYTLCYRKRGSFVRVYVCIGWHWRARLTERVLVCVSICVCVCAYVRVYGYMLVCECVLLIVNTINAPWSILGVYTRVKSPDVQKALISYVQCAFSGRDDCRPGVRFAGAVHVVNAINEVSCRCEYFMCVNKHTRVSACACVRECVSVRVCAREPVHVRVRVCVSVH